jgi:hypothetical protein
MAGSLSFVDKVGPKEKRNDLKFVLMFHFQNHLRCLSYNQTRPTRIEGVIQENDDTKYKITSVYYLITTIALCMKVKIGLPKVHSITFRLEVLFPFFSKLAKLVCVLFSFSSPLLLKKLILRFF